jgi:hypothetical protein
MPCRGLALLNRLFQRWYKASCRKPGVERGGLSGGTRRPSPRPTPLALPCDSKHIKKDPTNYHSLKRRFEKLAASVVSCGYLWVLASRGDGGLVHWQ